MTTKSTVILSIMTAFVGFELVGLVSGLTFLSSSQQTISTGKTITGPACGKLF